MRRILLAGVASLTFVGHAEARMWWIYNFGQDRCEVSQYSPDAMIQSMRNSNRFVGAPNVKTYRDNTGMVSGVDIQGTYTTGNGIELLYFDNEFYCQNVRRELHKDGSVTDRSELQ